VFDHKLRKELTMANLTKEYPIKDFIKNNTHLTRYFSAENLPILGDGMRMNTPGVGKPDSTFEKYVINRIFIL
jgi:hypothetical protein